MNKLQTTLVLGSLFLGLMVATTVFAELQIEKIQIEAEGVQSEGTGEGEVIITEPEIQEAEAGAESQTVIMPSTAEGSVSEKEIVRPLPANRIMRELDTLLKEAKKAKEDGNEQAAEEAEQKIEAIELPEGTVAGIPAEASIEARTGQDITNYYKVQVGELMREKMDVDQRIAMLKELRDNVDKLIEELIQAKEEITSEEMGGLVEEIKVKARQISADNVVVQTTAKKIIARLQKRPIEVRPTEEEVIIKDEEIEVRADEITIKDDGAIMVGTSEVKVTPSQIMANIGTQAPVQEMELAEEENQAVYKVKVSETRKLFGFIPIKITKKITASAVDAQVLKEKLPWWSFLTTR